MKKFILFLMLAIFLSAPAVVQGKRVRTARHTSNSQTFRFTDDMVRRIKNSCPATLKNASKKPESLEAFCSVKDLHFGEADLGPWKKFVQRAERLFLQFRQLIYVAAAFMILWIFVKASYEGDMKWMHIAMLIIGVIILAFAEVLLDIATNRVSLDDVVENGVYVDCRDKKTDNAYYRCNVNDDGATLYDERYFLQISGKTRNSRAKKYEGLY